MTRLQRYLIIAAAILIVGFVLGAKFASILAILGIGNEIRKNESETKEAKEEAKQKEQDYEEAKQQHDENIEEAGENIEAEEYDNADDARDGINDLLNDDDDSGGKQ